jgi:hypothetical protein
MLCGTAHFSVLYGIPEKSRHCLTDSLCLAWNMNSMCQNIALKHRCFQQKRFVTKGKTQMFVYNFAMPPFNSVSKWYIAMKCGLSLLQPK